MARPEANVCLKETASKAAGTQTTGSGFLGGILFFAGWMGEAA